MLKLLKVAFWFLLCQLKKFLETFKIQAVPESEPTDAPMFWKFNPEQEEKMISQAILGIRRSVTPEHILNREDFKKVLDDLDKILQTRLQESDDDDDDDDDDDEKTSTESIDDVNEVMVTITKSRFFDSYVFSMI